MTRAQALRALAAVFAAHGMESPQREARALLCAALGLDQATLLRDPDGALGSDVQRLKVWAARRLAGEPLSRIKGEREFWGLGLSVTSAVLDPRPDSETLIEAALALGLPRDAPLRIADLGTGSGALLAALLSEWPHARGVGIDSSPTACALAKTNLARHGFDGRTGVICGDWKELAGQEFDLIITNPPYIATDEIAVLAPEVRDHDPLAALDGGPDGLDAYRSIMKLLPLVLARGGFGVVELGQGQAADVSALAGEEGLHVAALRPDLAGIDRALVLVKSIESEAGK